MPIFNSTTSNSKTYYLAPSVNTQTVYDRGREELFRRVAELITTRGNTFTVYAAGQAVIPPAGAGSPTVTATSQLKVTFRIEPFWNALPNDPFDPTTNVRFQKPDKYVVKILYTGP
jgi:hypothetical protein